MFKVDNKTFNSLNPTYNACVGDNGGFYMHAYVKGYREAVEILLERVLAESYLLDSLVYPIIYNARHFVELSLKASIDNLKYINQVLGNKCDSIKTKTHQISRLLNTERDLSSAEIRYKEVILKLEEFVLDFADMDDSAETFRFHKDHKGEFHLKTQGCINLEAFAKRFAEMSEAFDDLSYMDDFLKNEYRVTTVVEHYSRATIESIAKEIPPKPWNNEASASQINYLMGRYGLSSEQFSKIVGKIESHREFASLIGMEIPLEGLSLERFSFFIQEYQSFGENNKHVDLKTYWENVYKVSDAFSLDEIAILAALREIGSCDGYYSEDYDSVREKRTEMGKEILLGEELLKSRQTMECIRKGLLMTGQKTLLKALE